MLENKKIAFFLLAIALAVVFTFTLADYVNEFDHAKTPWFHRTEREMILDLRMEIADLNYVISLMAIQNRYLRRLVYTTKPDHWTTWLQLLDECKRLERIIEEKNRKIKILETKLGIQLWNLPAPYRRI